MSKFEEALNAYVEAEIAYRGQTSLDGMDNGGPLGPRSRSLRAAVLAAHAAAVAEERERCATIAEHPYSRGLSLPGDKPGRVGQGIAAAIREGGKP